MTTPLMITVMAPFFESFIACPECGCHAKSHEAECPHCGERLRRADGSLPRTAAAVLLGLSAFTVPAATSMAGCGSGDGGGAGGVMSASAYGVGGTINMTGNGGAGGAGGSMGIGGAAPAYGVPQTDNDMDGYFSPGDDCNDDNKDIHPMAAETPGDGIDSNCNNDDNT